MRFRRGMVRIAAAAFAASVVCAGTWADPTSAQDMRDRTSAGEPTTRSGTNQSTRNDVPDTAPTPAVAPPVTQAGVIDPNEYVLGPGDVLELDLWGRLADVQPLAVSPEGKIFVRGAGPLAVAGHTLAWARDRVLAQMAETFRGVHADLKLVRLRTFKVYCSGLVTKPGALEVTSASRASEAIALAGLADGASRRNIRIVHRDGTQGALDLGLFEATGRQAFDPLLLDGDVLHVPRMTSFIEADGAVASPGRYELSASDSLATLLGLAGGLLPSAAPERALLTRFSGPSQRESLWLEAADLSAGTSALPLRDGDRLFVYYAADFHKSPTVEIYGEVQRPGAFPIVVGRDRLTDLMRWAGGFGPRANRSAVHLLRAAPDGKESDPEFERLARLTRQDMTVSEYAAFQTRLAERKNSFRVDFAHVEKGGSDADPLLRDGDFVRVDELVMSVRVEGEVRRPGFVDFAPGRRVDDYVQLVGGYTNRASRGTVRVSRSLTGQVVPARSAQSIEPGDFIWVPERKDVDAWQVFRDIVAVAGQIAVVVIASRR